MKRLAVYLLVIVSAILIWRLFEAHGAKMITMTKTRVCIVKFHSVDFGNCQIRCLENGSELGRVVLHRGIFEHPLAVFSTTDGKTLVCFSWLDTTYAAFAISTDRKYPQGIAIEGRFSEAVDYSEFNLRPCRKDEVAYLEKYIKNASLNELSQCIDGALCTDEMRQNMLDFLKLATSQNDYADPILKNAKPQIPTEG